MKRDHRLRRLSEDHHHALVLARRARLAADAGQAAAADRGPLVEIWQEIVRRFSVELEPHFQIEERLILPALDARLDAALVARTRDEHESLRMLVQHETCDLSERLADFGSLLAAHVRFEERVLFPVVERRVGSDVLNAIAAACADASPSRSRGKRDT